MGGVLKEIVMFPLVGEYIVVKLESKLLGGKNCPSTGWAKTRKMVNVSVAG